ncbi:unnamed protein product [Leptidea sinapis]|uniref:Gamma-glutamyltransferase 7 n=1 Tax=Leptidea sinapis TaxID=189913 RepID=A0A5E4R5N1_9NEOP|nr:unnamed protein product [Leptidea sinapis]
MSLSTELQSTPGVVELREDVPLKQYSTSSSLCTSGPRLIIGAFGVLTIAVTVALLTQIHFGDYQVVPHGSVSSSAAECSSVGTNVMRDGGGAIDAAIATTLCLAVVTPHRTSLDASGSLLYWEYRQSRTTEPTLIEWGGVGNAANINATGPPRLLVGLAALHAKLGVLSWSKLLQPAIDVARIGFNVSTGLAMAAASREILEYTAGEHRTEPLLAEYLQSGLSVAFGSGNITKNGWREDIPSAPLDLAPSILVDETVCGTRYIMGAESLSALAEGAAAVLVNGPLLVVKSVESARVLVETNGFLALEPDRLLPPAALSTLQLGPPVNASLPLPALNVIQQTGDTLLSHADSRGGGVASRF